MTRLVTKLLMQISEAVAGEWKDVIIQAAPEHDGVTSTFSHESSNHPQRHLSSMHTSCAPRGWGGGGYIKRLPVEPDI